MATSSSFSALTRQLANAIGEYCQEKMIQPYDVRQSDFIRWLKEEREFEKDELDEVRTHLQRVGGFVQLRNAFFSTSATPSLVEKTELQGIAKLSKSRVLDQAHDALFLARFQEVMSKVQKEAGKLVPFGYSVKPSRERTARVVTLMLSDLHFGSKLDPRELPIRYDFEEEARALASVIVRLCEFKLDYRNETALKIWLGGDLIRGKIHDKQSGRAMAEQVCDATWLLTQAIRFAAGQYKEVDVYCASGNHDRDETRHTDRAMDEKWDSRATAIYYAVKNAFQWDYKNVRVHIPRTPHCEWDALGHRFYGTHGDTDLNTGNPSKKIEVSSIDRQMTDINLAEYQAGRKPYSAFLAGHVHQGMHLPLPSGDLVINPALIPVDSYARSSGYRTSRFGQTLFETTPKYAVGDLRFMFVDGDVLKDKSLDKVVVPFRDF